MELTEKEIDKEIIKIEKEKLKAEIDSIINIRNQLIDLELDNLINYNKEADILELETNLKYLLGIVTEANNKILKIKTELNFKMLD